MVGTRRGRHCHSWQGPAGSSYWVVVEVGREVQRFVMFISALIVHIRPALSGWLWQGRSWVREKRCSWGQLGQNHSTGVFSVEALFQQKGCTKDSYIGCNSKLVFISYIFISCYISNSPFQGISQKSRWQGPAARGLLREGCCCRIPPSQEPRVARSLLFCSPFLPQPLREPPSRFVLIVERKRNNNKRPYSLETVDEVGTHDNPEAGKNCGPIL